jgi:sec-independent protein translocase protein TatA
MPFNLGFGEVLIILVVVLLLFGAKRIPEIAGSLGKGISQFKRNLTDVDRSIREGMDTDIRREPIEARREVDRRPDQLGAPDRDAVARADDDHPEPKRLLS